MVEHAVAPDSGGLRELPRPSERLTRFLLSAGSSALAILAVVGAEAVARWAHNYLMQTHGLHVFSDTYGWVPRQGTSA